MPLSTAITQEGTVSSETKAKIAQEITRIHSRVMNVPANFVRVVFLSRRLHPPMPWRWDTSWKRLDGVDLCASCLQTLTR